MAVWLQPGALNTENVKIKIYKAVLSDRSTGVVYRNLIPIKDCNGVICMHDTVTGLNFYDKGTTGFSCGNVVNEINYLQSQGKQYINMGNLAQNNIRAIIELEIPEAPTANTYFFGTNTSNYYRMGLGYDSSKRFIFAYMNNTSFTSTRTATNYWSPNTRYTIEAYWASTSRWWKINGTLIGNPSGTTNDANAGPLRLFAYSNSPNSKMKIYSCKVYVNDVLVADYIPVQDNNGKPCYFDNISHTYKYNATTYGSFLYG